MNLHGRAPRLRLLKHDHDAGMPDAPICPLLEAMRT